MRIRPKGTSFAYGMTNTLVYLLDSALALIGLVAIIWLSIRALKNTDSPAGLIGKWIFTYVLGVGTAHVVMKIWMSQDPVKGATIPILILVVGIIFSILWTPAMCEVITKPLTGLFDGGNEPQDARPLYSMAMAKRQRGKYLEATLAIREQLAKFPHDYEGISLLARIQAEDMKDIPSAEMTINRFCADPKAPHRQIAAALTQLADWHLQIAQDTDSARTVLEGIIARFPNTDMAVAAAQRIAHLGGTEKILLGKHDRQAIAVPHGVDNLGLMASTKFLIPEDENPGKLAAEYVKHLDIHPHDTDIREKLAVIYADHFNRLDLAVGELAQMINFPNQPPKRVAHWLTLLANLQIRHGADYDAVRQTLQKIVDTFPDLPVAQSARSRIAHLAFEFKGIKPAGPGVKLGEYEQNIGLKYGSPYERNG